MFGQFSTIDYVVIGTGRYGSDGTEAAAKCECHPARRAHVCVCTCMHLRSHVWYLLSRRCSAKYHRVTM